VEKIELPKVTHKAQNLGLKTIQPNLTSKKICIKKYRTSVCYFKKGTKFILKKMFIVDYKLDPDGTKKMSNEIAKKNSQNNKTLHG
jgi:hypothetical protein